METVKLTLILALLVTGLFCADARGESSAEWRRSAELQDALLRMIRGSPGGRRQPPGPPGRKGVGISANARKRHRFQTFVGLMGRRSFEEEEPRRLD